MPSRTPRSMTAEVESVLGPAPASYSQPEVVVLRFRRHGRRLVPPVVIMLILAAASGYWVGALPATWMNILAGIAGVALGLLLGVIPVLAWLAHRTTVTTRRVIVRHGLFSRHRSDISLGRVREVRMRRSILQRLRGSGEIDLLHGTERLRLTDVPGCEQVVDVLQELMERNYEQASRMQHRLSNLPEGAGDMGSAREHTPTFGNGAAPPGSVPDTDEGETVRFW